MYYEVIKLVAEHVGTVDKYGNEPRTYTAREVLANVRSIGIREFYNAAQTDYKPERALSGWGRFRMMQAVFH